MWILLTMTCWLLVISIMDIRSRRVPVWILAIGGIFAAAVSVYQYNSGEMGYIDVLYGILPGGLLLVIAYATKKAGYGDGIVLLSLGIVSGREKSLLIFGLSLLLISAWASILLALRKAKRDTGIPYLPFLTAAWLAFIK